MTPVVTGRLPWAQVPSALRRAAERQLGGAVTEAVTQPGGFSPGAAVRLRLDTGRRAFAKAVGPELNPDSPGIYRAEARIAAALPARVPAPRLLGTAEADGWVLLLFEDIDGAPPAQPWRQPELARVLAALTDLADSLTPSPLDAPAIADTQPFAGWRELLAGAARGADDLTGLGRWATSRRSRGCPIRPASRRSARSRRPRAPSRPTGWRCAPAGGNRGAAATPRPARAAGHRGISGVMLRAAP